MAKKLKKPKGTKDEIKLAHKKTGLVSEVEDDGSVFYYEDEAHKAKIKAKKVK